MTQQMQDQRKLLLKAVYRDWKIKLLAQSIRAAGNRHNKFMLLATCRRPFGTRVPLVDSDMGSMACLKNQT